MPPMSFRKTQEKGCNMKLFRLMSGRKTYFIAVATMLYAIFGYWQGHMDFDGAMKLILGGAGIGALRAGIAKGPQ